MPTYGQLQSEGWWLHEKAPTSLIDLRSYLITRYNWAGWRVGIIGDNKHLWGYHRSRNWILNSAYCTNGTRSVTETEGNSSGGNGDHVAAMDILTTETLVTAMADRVRGAMNAGRLPYVRQCIVEHNPSHLHLSFDRGLLEFDPSFLFTLLTGDGFGGTKMVAVHVTMPELQRGSEGDAVTTWQTLANMRGASLAVDGDFGPLTDAATRDIQARYGAESVDGIVGPETWCIGLAGEDQQ